MYIPHIRIVEIDVVGDRRVKLRYRILVASGTLDVVIDKINLRWGILVNQRDIERTAVTRIDSVAYLDIDVIVARRIARPVDRHCHDLTRSRIDAIESDPPCKCKSLPDIGIGNIGGIGHGSIKL